MTPEQQKALALANARKRMAESQAVPPQAAQPEQPEQSQGFINKALDYATSGIRGVANNPIGAAQSLATGASGGAAIPILGAIQAPFAYAGRDIASKLGYGDKPDARQLLNEYQDKAYSAFEPQRQFAKDNPLTDIALQVGGAILGAKGLGSTAIGQKAGQAARAALSGGNIATRTLARAGLGAASGAAYSAGTAKPGERTDAAKQGAVVGGLVATAVPAAASAVVGSYKLGKNVKAGLSSATPEILTETADKMRAAASAVYNQARQTGAVLSPKASTFLGNRVARAVNSAGMTNPRLHGDTLSVLKQMQEVPKKGGFFDLQELDQYRQLFSDVVNKNTVNGRANADAMLATRAIKAIDSAADGLDQSSLLSGSTQSIEMLKNARAAWGKVRAFEKLSDVVTGAAGDPNRLKSALSRFANNKNNLRGLSEVEIKAIKEAGDTSGGEKLARLLGTFGFDLGNKLSGKNAALAGLGTAGGAFLNPAILAPVAIGTAARSVARQSARGAAQRALDTIAARPVGQAVQSVVAAPATTKLLSNPLLPWITSQQTQQNSSLARLLMGKGQ